MQKKFKKLQALKNITMDLYTEKVLGFIGPNGAKSSLTVSYLLASKKSRKREFQTLEKISDNYKKLVLTMDSFTSDQNGIKHHNLVDWLL